MKTIFSILIAAFVQAGGQKPNQNTELVLQEMKQITQLNPQITACGRLFATQNLKEEPLLVVFLGHSRAKRSRVSGNQIFRFSDVEIKLDSEGLSTIEILKNSPGPRRAILHLTYKDYVESTCLFNK